ncbi:MAG: ABC transporter substrate-binding protein, partial [Firmicutes bacterium]|nr:ABC transporter substrate-binding protein [Bacillota bacterium]
MKHFWKRCAAVFAALAIGAGLTGCTTYKNFHAAFFEKNEEQEVIKIGIFEPQTGADAADAAEEIKGIELARKLYPEVMGKRIEFVYGDNQSDVEMAKTAAQQLVDSGVRLVLGSYKSTLSLAGSDIFEAADVPAIGISITNPIVTQTNEFYFRVCFIDAFQGL